MRSAPTRRSAILAALAALPALGSSCQEESEPPPDGVLEIGRQTTEGTFDQLAPGESIPVVLGANGLNMIEPSLRAVGIDPRAPDPTVTVAVEDVVMAADIEGARVDMQPDGTGYVLWKLKVPFQTELCCFNCREGVVTARIRDASGRNFVGRGVVTLARGDCPDPATCCASTDDCPDPELTQVCP